jgi:hypothetical protein
MKLNRPIFKAGKTQNKTNPQGVALPQATPPQRKQFWHTQKNGHGRGVPFACSFFFIFDLWYRLTTMNPLNRQLANVEWELFLSYTNDDGALNRRLDLWAELDRLEALIELDS